MRDILGDLQDRANLIGRQIKSEHVQFGELTAQLKREHDGTLEGLKTQLEAVNRLIAVAAWQHNVRATLKLAITVTAAVEQTQPSLFRVICGR